MFNRLLGHKSIKAHILSTGIVRFFQMGSGFFCSLLLARWLQPEGFGIFATLMVCPMILISLAELGLRQSAAYAVGKCLASIRDVSGTLSTMWLITSVLSFLVVSIFLYSQGLHSRGWTLLLIVGCIPPVALASKYAEGIALGRQWIPRINVCTAVFGAARLILLVAFVVVLKGGVLGALGMELLSVLAAGLIMLYWLKDDVTFRPRWDSQLAASMVRKGFAFAMALFLLGLNYRVSLLILQHFVSEGDIGQFSLGVRVSEIIWLAPSAIGCVIFSHSAGSENPGGFAGRASQIMRFTLLLGAVGAAILGISCEPFVRTIFGSAYLPSVPAIRILLPGIVAAIIFKVLYPDLAGRGRPMAAVWVFLMMLLINVLLNFVLVPRFGILGSAAAVSTSYMLGAVIFTGIYAKLSGMTFVSLFFQPMHDWKKLKAACGAFRPIFNTWYFSQRDLA